MSLERLKCNVLNLSLGTAEELLACGVQHLAVGALNLDLRNAGGRHRHAKLGVDVVALHHDGVHVEAQATKSSVFQEAALPRASLTAEPSARTARPRRGLPR